MTSASPCLSRPEPVVYLRIGQLYFLFYPEARALIVQGTQRETLDRMDRGFRNTLPPGLVSGRKIRSYGRNR